MAEKSGDDSVDLPKPVKPLAVRASAAPPKTKASNYPEPFFSRMLGRQKHPLGDLFGLRNFGVNLTRLPPGQVSALHHRHSRQDEFIYVLEGRPTLCVDDAEIELEPGQCAGFAAGTAAHHLVNHGTVDAVILEVGDRSPGDTVDYPADDLQAELDENGKWRFRHKDGSPY